MIEQPTVDPNLLSFKLIQFFFFMFCVLFNSEWRPQDYLFPENTQNQHEKISLNILTIALQHKKKAKINTHNYP